MARFLKKIDKTVGLPPGSFVVVGTTKSNESRIRKHHYSSDSALELELSSIESFCAEAEGKTWLEIDGIHDIPLVESLKSIFSISPLFIEDLLNANQRPKAEEMDDRIFIILKRVLAGKNDGKIHTEQVGIIISSDTVITLQEGNSDVFGPVRNRIQNGKGRIRRMDTAYLAFVLLDLIAEEYIKHIEKLGDIIEGLEDEVLNEPTPHLLETISTCKRELGYIKKAIKPVKEVTHQLLRMDSLLLTDESRPYLKDLNELVLSACEAAEVYSDILTDYMYMYSSAIANRTNEAMKFLTIFATIFIPLTFIVGVYGMNFQHMPELQYEWGYPIVLTLMGSITLVMLVFFKIKKWF